MRGFFGRMNPTLRGFLIILAICAVVVVLQLQNTLIALTIIARVAFILAIAFFVFLVWRERRADIAVYWYGGAHGLQVIAFVAVIAGCGFAMFRIWRDQHHYV